MGSWLAGLLKSQGLEVISCGRSTMPQPKDIASTCEVIVLSVPIRATIDLIKQVGPLIPKEGLFMDLTSIKTETMEAMLRYSRSAVVGLHPLFGPEATGKRGDLKVAVCPGRGDQALDWSVKMLESGGLKPLLISPRLHDHLMGIIQGVQHFAMIAFAMTILRSGYELEDLMAFATPSFGQIANRIRAILNQPAELFGPLMMDNPFSLQSIQSYTQCSEQLKGIVQRKDMDSLGELFLSLKQYFKGEEANYERDMG